MLHPSHSVTDCHKLLRPVMEPFREPFGKPLPIPFPEPFRRWQATGQDRGAQNQLCGW